MPISKRKFRKNKKNRTYRQRKKMLAKISNNHIGIKPDYSLKAWDRYAVADRNSERLELVNDTDQPNVLYALGLVFRLSALPQYITYQDMWEYYKINYVVVYFTPYRVESVIENTSQQIETESTSTQTGTGTATGSGFDVEQESNSIISNNAVNDIGRIPNYVVVLDRDDQQGSNYNQLATRSGAKIQRVTKSMSIGFTPNTLSLALNARPSILGNSPDINITPELLGWKVDTQQCFIDTEKADLPHYGLKCAIEQTGATPGQYRIKISTKYYVTFGGRRR